MEYSLSAAAKATGKGKSTIHRAIKNGTLSARRDGAGSYHIDASELARVFQIAANETSHRNNSAPGAEPSGSEAAVLAVKVAMLESQLERERENVDDLRKRLDKAEDRAYALTHQPSVPQKGLFRRLLG